MGVVDLEHQVVNPTVASNLETHICTHVYNKHDTVSTTLEVYRIVLSEPSVSIYLFFAPETQAHTQKLNNIASL